MLADAAQVADGKLYLLGGAWEVYRCQSFPAQVPFGVALAFLIDQAELGKRFPISIVVADDGGVPIIPEIKGEIAAGAQPGTPPAAQHRSLLSFNGTFTIPREGRYVVNVSGGGSTVRTGFTAIFSGTKISLPGITNPGQSKSGQGH